MACETEPVKEKEEDNFTSSITENPISLNLKKKFLKHSTNGKSQLRKYGEIVFSEASLLNGKKGPMLFPVIDKETRKINYWISGYYYNKSIRFKIGPATIDMSIEEWAKARRFLKIGSKFSFSQTKPSQKATQYYEVYREVCVSAGGGPDRVCTLVYWGAFCDEDTDEYDDGGGGGPDNPSWEDPDDSGGGGGNGGNGGNSGDGDSENDDEELVKIDNRLDGKELCAYKRMEWAGVNPSENFMNMMTQLFQEFGANNIGGADLIIAKRDLGYRGGSTRILPTGEFEIIISGMGKRSSIEIAAVLIHEISHAFLAKHYNLRNSSFEELYSKYINDQGLQNYSHDIMADYFIGRMAQVLKDYDDSLFSNFEDYKILASYGVFKLNDYQLSEYNRVRNYAKNNDKRCKDK